MDGWLPLADKVVRHHEGLGRKLATGMVMAWTDPTGRWLIGYGSSGEDIGKGTVWTVAQCEARLLDELSTLYGPAVDRLTEGVPTSAGQKAALVSFARSEGLERLAESTLLRMHRDGNVGGAGEQFLHWTYRNGSHTRDKVAVREAERAIYLGIPRHA